MAVVAVRRVDIPQRKTGRPLSRETVFRFCKEAARAAGIAKSVRPRSLRHYAASRTMPKLTSQQLFISLFQLRQNGSARASE